MKALFNKLSEKTQDNIIVYGGTLLVTGAMLAAVGAMYFAMWHDFHKVGLV